MATLLWLSVACTTQQLRLDRANLQPVSLQQASTMIGDTLFTSVYKHQTLLDKVKSKH